MSCGIEAAEDIKEDLGQALASTVGGAGDRIRTGDSLLGRQGLYH